MNTPGSKTGNALQNDVAENLNPEIEKLAKEKRIQFDLRKFPKLTEGPVRCMDCGYFGRMGVVSSKLKPWVWKVIAFSLPLSFWMLALHFHEGINTPRVILGLTMLIQTASLYFAKRNRQLVYCCPSCKQHQLDEESESPPWLKWWKLFMVIAYIGTALLLIIAAGAAYFYKPQVNKASAEQLALAEQAALRVQKAKAINEKRLADLAQKLAQLKAAQQASSQPTLPSINQSQIAASSSNTQSPPAITSSVDQSLQNTSHSINTPDWRPSGFALVDDVAAVPNLNERGRSIYRDFLTHPSPRAFLICQDGRFSTMFVVGNHQDKLNAMLTNRASGCEPYAVNNEVVWAGR